MRKRVLCVCVGCAVFQLRILRFVVRLEEGGGGGILVSFVDLAFVRGGVQGWRYWVWARFRISLLVLSVRG